MIIFKYFNSPCRHRFKRNIKITGHAKRRNNLAISVKSNITQTLTSLKSWENRKQWRQIPNVDRFSYV